MESNLVDGNVSIENECVCCMQTQSNVFNCDKSRSEWHEFFFDIVTLFMVISSQIKYESENVEATHITRAR